MNPLIKFILTLLILIVSIPAFILIVIGGIIEYIGNNISSLGAYLMNKIT